MESLLFLLAIALIFLVISPFIILYKVGDLSRQIRSLSSLIKEVDTKVEKVIKKAATDHIREVRKANIEEEKTVAEEIKQKDILFQPERLIVPTVELISPPEPEPKVVTPEDIPVIHEPEEVKEEVPVIIEETPAPEEHPVLIEELVIEEEKEEKVLSPKYKPIHLEQPKVTKSNPFDQISGENLLSKIGIVTLVLGIAFFVKYAIDKEWINEVGRVGIGLLTGGILIGVAHKLRKQYDVFSSILAGGGIAVLYITITLAFREYALLSQTVAFIALILITIFSVILSLVYDKRELALFSQLGGFASPLMVSTGAGNYIVLFSYIFILNTGMLIISYYKNWRSIGISAFALTQFFVWLWLYRSFEYQYTGAALFLTLFFVQFYILSVLDHLKNKGSLSPYHSFLLISNNITFFLASLFVFWNYQADVRGLITIILALFNGVALGILYRNGGIDRKFIYLLIAIVLSFVSLAIPIQLEGKAITMFWGAEMVVLAFLWRKSGIKTFMAAYKIITALVLISYAMDILPLLLDSEFKYTVLFNQTTITGCVVIAGFILSMWLLKKQEPGTEQVLEPSTEILLGTYFLTMVKGVLIVLTFIVPFTELKNILHHYDTFILFSELKYLYLATYTYIHIAVLTWYFRKDVKNKDRMFVLLAGSIALFLVLYTPLACEVRLQSFQLFSKNLFWLHILVLPALTYTITWMGRYINNMPASRKEIFTWLLVIMTVAILTYETDHIALLLTGNEMNYYDVLHDVHTFVYPVIWGIMAMILMIWGLKKKELILRKISLFFFAFIIVKFYIWDVWRMSQAGRIVSFVLLGLILLLVSFMQQKIKTLMKKDEEDLPEKIDTI